VEGEGKKMCKRGTEKNRGFQVGGGGVVGYNILFYYVL